MVCTFMSRDRERERCGRISVSYTMEVQMALSEDVEEGKLGVIRVKDVGEKARCSGSALVEAGNLSTPLICVMDYAAQKLLLRNLCTDHETQRHTTTSLYGLSGDLASSANALEVIMNCAKRRAR